MSLITLSLHNIFSNELKHLPHRIKQNLILSNTTFKSVNFNSKSIGIKEKLKMLIVGIFHESSHYFLIGLYDLANRQSKIKIKK